MPLGAGELLADGLAEGDALGFADALAEGEADADGEALTAADELAEGDELADGLADGAANIGKMLAAKSESAVAADIIKFFFIWKAP